MFDLSLPMKGCVMNQSRYLFLEGDMKFKDNIGKVSECSWRSAILRQILNYVVIPGGRPLFPPHRYISSL
jgi:hypothetical protein